MDMNFKDQVAVVTGGYSGIGQSTALAFAKRGARVVVGDVADCSETLARIKAAGGEAIAVECDVSRMDHVQRLMRTAEETYGRLDHAFNNAGIAGAAAACEELAEADWDRLMGVNLKGVWMCMKHQIPLMAKHGKGSIVNCASILGSVGFANASAYVASKHGVNGLTRAVALEQATKGIRVNSVCPGFIHTPMLDQAVGGSEEGLKQFAALEPMMRMGTPEEVAEAVVWLCSDGASFVSGHCMAVDGAYLAR